MPGMYDPTSPTSGSRPTAEHPKRGENPLPNIGSDPPQMPELMLTSAQRQALRARAHDLKPVVLLGAAGLTEMVLREIDRALAVHELVKIKVPGEDRGERAQIATDVAEKLSAAKVQSIGKMIVLFRPSPESEEKQETDAPLGRRADGRRHSRKIAA